MFIAHLEEEGLFIYCQCGRRRAICLLSIWKKKGYLFIALVEEGLVYYPCERIRVFLFIAHVEKGLIVNCPCGRRAICFSHMWKEKGYLFIAHVEEGLFIYCPCGIRMASCLLPMWKKGYLSIAHVE